MGSSIIDIFCYENLGGYDLWTFTRSKSILFHKNDKKYPKLLENCVIPILRAKSMEPELVAWILEVYVNMVNWSHRVLLNYIVVRHQRLIKEKEEKPSYSPILTHDRATTLITQYKCTQLSIIYICCIISFSVMIYEYDVICHKWQ